MGYMGTLHLVVVVGVKITFTYGKKMQMHLMIHYKL